MTEFIESISLDGGKDTLQLSQAGCQTKFEALRNGEPWRDMSSDGDKLMLAMFHQLREQQARIDELEAAAADSAQRTERIARRYKVEEGSEPALEAEPTYIMKMDASSRFIDVRPQGIAQDQLREVPHPFAAVEINKGARVLAAQQSAEAADEQQASRAWASFIPFIHHWQEAITQERQAP
ncbi:MAG: hypothetical protein JSS14_22485 [Proteobacteria bacterium]|nr:hypothetical protein [Pseudomonadota bacterium]